MKGESKVKCQVAYHSRIFSAVIDITLIFNSMLES